MHVLLILLLALLPITCGAAEIDICYNWSCAATAHVKLSDEQMDVLQRISSEASDAQTERVAIADAIGVLEVFTAQQSPTGADRGGNWNDQNVDGRMDCIDDSTNTMTYLKLMEEYRWLKFHLVGERVKRVRFLGISVHWAGSITTIDGGERYAVDSWFYDDGHPAVIYPLQDWLSGQSPDD